MTIKNQPFVPYYDNSSGCNINFYYNIRIKGHYSEDWIELCSASDGYPTQDSGSEYTVFSYQGDYSSTEGMEFKAGSIMTTFPPGAQVDFQVEAMIGYVHRSGEPPWFPWVFTGEKSGWSETQTITISASATEPPTEPPPEDSNGKTGLDPTPLIIAVPIMLAIILGAVFYRKRKHSAPGASLDSRLSANALCPFKKYFI